MATFTLTVNEAPADMEGLVLDQSGVMLKTNRLLVQRNDDGDIHRAVMTVEAADDEENTLYFEFISTESGDLDQLYHAFEAGPFSALLAADAMMDMVLKQSDLAAVEPAAGDA